MRPVENAPACQSELSNLFLMLHGPRFKTLSQQFKRTPELEHLGIWEIADMRLLPVRTQRKKGDRPERKGIRPLFCSYVEPRGCLTKFGEDNHEGDHSEFYSGMPIFD